MRARRKPEREVFGIVESRWKKSSEITTQPRMLKYKVREFNNGFGEDAEHDVYIISGAYGYRLTKDKDEIMRSIEHEKKLAKIRFKQANNRWKKAEDFFTANERLPL